MSFIGPGGLRPRTDIVSGSAPRRFGFMFYFPIVLAIVWPVALVLVWCGPFVVRLFGPPLVLLCWAVSGLLALVIAFFYAARREWRRFAAVSFLALTTIAAFLNLEFVWRTAQNAGDRVHFLAARPYYLREVAKLQTGEPRLVVFNWGGVFGLSQAVVYDESDEMDSTHRSAAWKARADLTELSCGAYGTTPLGDHFYLVSLSC
jgi:hypothetical protein